MLYYILLIGMTSCLSLFGCCIFIPNLSYLLKIFYPLLAGEETLIVVTHIVNEKSQKEFNNLCKDIYRDYELLIHEKSYDEIKIIPKNIRIGEDLEAANAVPIFKEGKYVIVKSDIHPVFFRVFEEEGKEEAYVMEAIEEDIQALREDVPEFEKYITTLELKKHLPTLDY